MPRNFSRLFARSLFVRQPCLLIGALHIGALIVIASAQGAAADDIMVTKAPPTRAPSAYDWSGFYAGGHLGYAWGSSNWTAGPSLSGSFDLAQPIDTFSETGSFFAGLQAGYNYMLPNRFVVGAEVDASFPSFQNLAGISIGGTSNLTSPTLGAETYSETVLASGALRGRLGYAPGSWLFYATGGFDSSVLGRPNRRSCGDWVSRPARASRRPLRRIGRRGLNICSRITATAAQLSLQARSELIPILCGKRFAPA